MIDWDPDEVPCDHENPCPNAIHGEPRPDREAISRRQSSDVPRETTAEARVNEEDVNLK